MVGVVDTVLPQFKCAVGLREDDRYINSGVLLIDLQKWRQHKIQDRFEEFYYGKWRSDFAS